MPNTATLHTTPHSRSNSTNGTSSHPMDSVPTLFQGPEMTEVEYARFIAFTDDARYKHTFAGPT
ncbi:hypothetical protein BGX38DRAFT_1233432 [Terfezia claveryi]|nr:hypothetical protein BGX38DRAFT_1233432 [Terfezia claveryi]